MCEEDCRKNVERIEHIGQAQQDHKDEGNFGRKAVAKRKPSFKAVKEICATKARSVVGTGGNKG